MVEVLSRSVLRVQHLRLPDDEQDLFESVLKHAPPELSIKHDSSRKASAPTREVYVERLKLSFGKARKSLNKAQSRYKKTFGKRVRLVQKL